MRNPRRGLAAYWVQALDAVWSQTGMRLRLEIPRRVPD